MTDETTETTEVTTEEPTNETVETAEEPVNIEDFRSENERLQSELKKVREEAAARRVELREVKEQFANTKTVDEYNELVAKYEQEAAARQHDKLVSLHAANLPTEIRESVSWPTEEAEIKALAQKLSPYAVVYGESKPATGGLGNRNDGDDPNDYDPAALAARIYR